MKFSYLTYLILFVFINPGAHSQSLDRYCITVSGNYSQNEMISLEWSIGEVVTESINNNDFYLSQGFHQNFDYQSLYSVSGEVWAGNQHLDSGKIQVVPVNLPAGFSAPYESQIVDGKFTLSFIPVSEFYLLAVPFNDEYRPTYFAHSANKEKAVVLTSNGNIGDINIQLLLSESGTPEILTNKTPFELYPNPANNFVCVKFSEGIVNQSHIKIFDIFGKVVYQRSVINENSMIMNVEDLTNGIYFVEIEISKQVFTRKMIKIN